MTTVGIAGSISAFALEGRTLTMVIADDGKAFDSL